MRGIQWIALFIASASNPAVLHLGMSCVVATDAQWRQVRWLDRQCRRALQFLAVMNNGATALADQASAAPLAHMAAIMQRLFPGTAPKASVVEPVHGRARYHPSGGQSFFLPYFLHAFTNAPVRHLGSL